MRRRGALAPPVTDYVPNTRCTYYEYSEDSDNDSMDGDVSSLLAFRKLQRQKEQHQGGYFGYTTQGDTFFTKYTTPRRESITTITEGKPKTFFSLRPLPNEIIEEDADDEEESVPSESEDSESDSQSVSESDSDPSAIFEHSGRLSDEKVLAKSSPTTVKRILIEHNRNPKALLYLPQTFFDTLRQEFEDAQRHSPASRKRKFVKTRDWNKEMQELLQAGIVAISKENIIKAADLSKDFCSCAENYAKIIVDELGIDVRSKTLKPADVGGIAGGTKYIVHGILFKFCLDIQIGYGKSPLWMYGYNERNDELAMKVAGLELKGLDQWQVTHRAGIHFPLMALIDYKGFRLVATSLLPVNKKTLIYGSNDGGRVVRASDQHFNKMMAEAGTCLNLKPHRVGRKATIYGPGDIEGHKGKDGRYYLLDFARTMPPEAPEYGKDGKPIHPRGVFYRMLRPELLMENPVPLSSDVFSGWGESDRRKTESQREVQEATKLIITERIPTMIKELLAIDTSRLDAICSPNNQSKFYSYSVDNFVSDLRFAHGLHAHGVNVRFMGVLRKEMKDELWRKVLLSLGVARVLKCELRSKLREALRSNATSESANRRMVAEIFNQIFRHYWPSKSEEDSIDHKYQCIDDQTLQEKLEKKFPGILTEEEKAAPITKFLHKFSPRLVLARLLNLGVVKFAPKMIQAIAEVTDFSTFQMVDGDIEELSAKVRTGVVFTGFNAIAYQNLAKEKMKSNTKLLILSELLPPESSLDARELLYSCAFVPMQRIKMASDPSNPESDAPEIRRNGEAATTNGHRYAYEPRPNFTRHLHRLRKCALTQIDYSAFPRTEHYMRTSIARSEPPSDSLMVQARRLLKKASEYLAHGSVGDYSSIHQMVLWGDILKDLAETHSSWQKIDRWYEAAYAKFRTAELRLGVYKMLLFVWAEALKRHADAAEKFGYQEKAHALRREAEEKIVVMEALSKALEKWMHAGSSPVVAAQEKRGEQPTSAAAEQDKELKPTTL